MLTRRLLLASLAGIVSVVFWVSPGVADGTGSVQCDKGSTNPGCDVGAGTGGDGGSGHNGGTGGGRGGGGKCHAPSGKEIPCERDGGVAGSDGCYYTPADPSPESIAALGGQPAGAGGWYVKVCYNDDGTATGGLGGAVWVPGAPPAVDPAVLARQARSRLNLPSVVIGLNPPGVQTVKFPVWLTMDPASWKPQSATASAGAVSVTATARPVRAVWSMGDGGSRACAGPGTAWSPGIDPSAESPDCGYKYRHSSSGGRGGKFVISVTVTWEVTWAGAGQTGTVPGLETTGQVQAAVQESQAVISR